MGKRIRNSVLAGLFAAVAIAVAGAPAQADNWATESSPEVAPANYWGDSAPSEFAPANYWD